MKRAQTAGKFVFDAYAGTAKAWKMNMHAIAGIMKFNYVKKKEESHDVRTTLHGRYYNIRTLQRRPYNVVLTSCTD